MLLSRDAILKHYEEKRIIIDPFDERNLKTASYDITLGEWFWREGQSHGRPTVHNPYDEKSTEKLWDGPFQAEQAEKVAEQFNVKPFENIRPTDKVILLEPGEAILGHTQEFIGGRDICVAKMYARSSLGRNFIEVCRDAGWGDVGYFNRWTMEITNNSRHSLIALVVGRRIAQMVFYEVAPLKSNSSDYAKDAGKYQVDDDLKKVKETWNPRMMIPKMHLDREVNEG